MEENLDKLERQQQDALERWRIRSERAGLALDKLEGQISIINDPIGTNLETIRRQGDTFEVRYTRKQHYRRVSDRFVLSRCRISDRIWSIPTKYPNAFDAGFALTRKRHGDRIDSVGNMY